MPGVVLRLPSLSGATNLAGWAEQLGISARTLQITAAAITQEELEAAVDNIKRISPVKTGLFRRSWRVLRTQALQFAVVDLAPYASFVHRRGEKGTTFVEAYAKPEIESAVRRVRVRLKEALRDSVRAQAASALAPTLRRSIVASQLRFALQARGRR
jgi:hypothetical protein